MRLIDLEPRWLSPDLFIFRNPTGGKDLLTCKISPMGFLEQHRLIYTDHPEYKGRTVVMTAAPMAWTINTRDFSEMTVHPSIDCSLSGNWHGFIQNGAIV